MTAKKWVCATARLCPTIQFIPQNLHNICKHITLHHVILLWTFLCLSGWSKQYIKGATLSVMKFRREIDSDLSVLEGPCRQGSWKEGGVGRLRQNRSPLTHHLFLFHINTRTHTLSLSPCVPMCMFGFSFFFPASACHMIKIGQHWLPRRLCPT